MSTYRQNLLTRRDAIAAELAAIENHSLQTDAPEYSANLFAQLKEIDGLLNSANSTLDADALANDKPRSWTEYEYGEP